MIQKPVQKFHAVYHISILSFPPRRAHFARASSHPTNRTSHFSIINVTRSYAAKITNSRASYTWMFGIQNSPRLVHTTRCDVHSVSLCLFASMYLSSLHIIYILYHISFVSNMQKHQALKDLHEIDSKGSSTIWHISYTRYHNCNIYLQGFPFRFHLVLDILRGV